MRDVIIMQMTYLNEIFSENISHTLTWTRRAFLAYNILINVSKIIICDEYKSLHIVLIFYIIITNNLNKCT